MKRARVSLIVAAHDIHSAAETGLRVLQLLGWEAIEGSLKGSPIPQRLLLPPTPDSEDAYGQDYQVRLTEQVRKAWETGFHIHAVALEDARELLGPIGDLPMPPDMQ